MGDLQAGDRPIFDFDGSRELAALMYATARSLERAAALRWAAWDEVLAGWEGDVGKHFRALIEQEKEDLKSTVNTLEVNAQDWARQWVTNVDETNDVIKAETWEEYKKLLDKKDEGFQLHDLNPFQKDKSLDDVPNPSPIATPAPEGFGEPRSPFIHYYVSEDGVEIQAYKNFWPPPQ